MWKSFVPGVTVAGMETFGWTEVGVILQGPDLVVTLMAAQKHADFTQDSVFVYEGDEFIGEIVPRRMCDGCGSLEIGPTEAACLACSICAHNEIWR